MKRNVIFLSIFFFFTFLSYSYASSDCSLAIDVAKKGIEAFKKDRKKGLKFLVKASTLCPDNEAINFNTGLAYYKYKNFYEASKYLKKAVKISSENAEALNLLAWTLLHTDSEIKQALKYAQKADGINKNNPAFQDTLIYAHLKNRNFYNALTLAHEAKARWTRNTQIERRYDHAAADYLDFYVHKFKQGYTDQALEGLKKIDFDYNIVSATCYLLQKKGESKKALALAKEKQSRFPNLADVFHQVADNIIQEQFKEFQKGNRQTAYKEIESLASLYGLKEFISAKDRMLDAVLTDDTGIDIPEPKTYAGSKSGNQASDIVAGLYQKQPEQDIDLVVDVNKNIPTSGTKKPDAIAVVIGNKNYQNNIHDVEYALRDADYVKKYLVSLLGYEHSNIIYKQDAKQSDFNIIFGDSNNYKGKLYDWVKKGSEVFIYYSGHGVPSIKSGQAFLVPVDANVNYIQNTGYRLETFYNNIKKIPAGKITVVLDACFSGNSSKGMLIKAVSPAGLESASPVASVKNSLIFSSTSKGEVSHWFEEKRHGLFTYFFLKGLQGAADKDKNREITVRELKDYLKDNVSYRARRMRGGKQNPVIMGDETWVFARLR